MALMNSVSEQELREMIKRIVQTGMFERNGLAFTPEQQSRVDLAFQIYQRRDKTKPIRGDFSPRAASEPKRSVSRIEMKGPTNPDGFKIISGGQTGADRAALDWAIKNGIEYGGWCPKGRRAEDGAIPSQYQLQETASIGYLQCTEWNVRDSAAPSRRNTRFSSVIHRHGL